MHRPAKMVGQECTGYSDRLARLNRTLGEGRHLDAGTAAGNDVPNKNRSLSSISQVKGIRQAFPLSDFAELTAVRRGHEELATKKIGADVKNSAGESARPKQQDDHPRGEYDF